MHILKSWDPDAHFFTGSDPDPKSGANMYLRLVSVVGMHYK